MPSAHDILRSPELRRLVRRKWTVAALLSACLFALYYGYVLLIAYDPGFLARRVGAHTTLGILLGAAVIVGSWALTGVYVLWANGSHDKAVHDLRERLRE